MISKNNSLTARNQNANNFSLNSNKELSIEENAINYIKNLETKIQNQATRLTKLEEYKIMLETIIDNTFYNDNNKISFPIDKSLYHSLLNKSKEMNLAYSQYDNIRLDLERILIQKKKMHLDNSNETDKLIKENKSLIGENLKLKDINEKLVKDNSKNTMEKEIQSLYVEIEKLKEENSKLSAVNSSINANKDTLIDYNKKYNLLSKEHNKLQDTYEDISNKNIRLSKEIKLYIEEIDIKANEINKLKNNQDEYEKNINKLENKLTEKESKLELIDKQLIEKENIIEYLNNTIKRIKYNKKSNLNINDSIIDNNTNCNLINTNEALENKIHIKNEEITNTSLEYIPDKDIKNCSSKLHYDNANNYYVSTDTIQDYILNDNNNLIDQLKKSISYFKSKCEFCEKEILSLKDRINLLNELKNNQNYKLQKTNLENQSLKSNIECLKKSHEEEVLNLKAEIKNLNNKINSNEFNKIEFENHVLKEEILFLKEKLKNDNELKSKEIQEIYDKINNITTSKNEISSVNIELNNKIDEKEDKIKELNIEIDSMKNYFEEKIKEKDNLIINLNNKIKDYQLDIEKEKENKMLLNNNLIKEIDQKTKLYNDIELDYKQFKNDIHKYIFKIFNQSKNYIAILLESISNNKSISQNILDKNSNTSNNSNYITNNYNINLCLSTSMLNYIDSFSKTAIKFESFIDVLEFIYEFNANLLCEFNLRKEIIFKLNTTVKGQYNEENNKLIKDYTYIKNENNNLYSKNEEFKKEILKLQEEINNANSVDNNNNDINVKLLKEANNSLLNENLNLKNQILEYNEKLDYYNYTTIEKDEIISDNELRIKHLENSMTIVVETREYITKIISYLIQDINWNKDVVENKSNLSKLISDYITNSDCLLKIKNENHKLNFKLNTLKTNLNNNNTMDNKENQYFDNELKENILNEIKEIEKLINDYNSTYNLRNKLITELKISIETLLNNNFVDYNSSCYIKEDTLDKNKFNNIKSYYNNKKLRSSVSNHQIKKIIKVNFESDDNKDVSRDSNNRSYILDNKLNLEVITPTNYKYNTLNNKDISDIYNDNFSKNNKLSKNKIITYKTELSKSNNNCLDESNINTILDKTYTKNLKNIEYIKNTKNKYNSSIFNTDIKNKLKNVFEDKCKLIDNIENTELKKQQNKNKELIYNPSLSKFSDLESLAKNIN